MTQSTGEGLAVIEEAGEKEEEEEEELPLKRKRTVRVSDLSSCPSDKGKGKEKEGEKGKGKKRTTDAGKWVSTIRLNEAASIADFDVALHIAEKAVPPTAEKLTDSLDNEELSARLVRSCVRDLAYAFAMRQRVEQLGREVPDLLEQVKALKAELSGIKEDRDFVRAQLSSLEEEKKAWEEDRSILKAQLTSGEEEKGRVVAARDELEEKCRALQLANEGLEEKCRALQLADEGLRGEVFAANSKAKKANELLSKILPDYQQAVDMNICFRKELVELRSSVKRERIAAIKRWKTRHLQEECQEYACDLALSILKSCHDASAPDGSDRPSFEDYAEPMLPPGLGLSLREMREMVEGEQRVIPDEELDLSSDESDEEEEEKGEQSHGGASPVLSAGSGPVSAAHPTSLPANPVAGASPPSDPTSAVVPTLEAALPTFETTSSEPTVGSSPPAEG